MLIIGKFQWITNRSATAFVSLDVYERLYISSPARKLMELPSGQFHLLAGYDFANHRIVFANPDIVYEPGIEPFKFDKRAYSKAKYLVEKAQLQDDLPIRFTYIGKDVEGLPKGSFAFQREVSIAEDN